ADRMRTGNPGPHRGQPRRGHGKPANVPHPAGPRAARRLIAVVERSDARELGLEPRTPARSPAGVRTAWLRRRRHQPGFCGGVLRVHQGEARRHVLGLRLRLAAALVAAEVPRYTEGSVVIDVIDPKTKQLLWRGQGVAAVSDDERRYEGELKKTVTAILDKFPDLHAD